MDTIGIDRCSHGPELDEQVWGVTTPAPIWHTYAEAAAAIRVKPNTLMIWVKQGRVASPTYIGAKALFSNAALAKMCLGIDPPGTHEPAPSVRSQTQAAVWKQRKARERDAARKRAARAARKKEPQHEQQS